MSARPEPVSRFTASRRIEFVDTDMGGIVHFSRFFVFMETTEHLFLESLGTRVHVEVEGRQIGWPRVAASLEFASPARFGDVLEIELTVLRRGATSMTYGFEFRVGERRVARGEMSSVCCVLDDPSGLRAIAVPAAIADRVVAAGRQ